MPFRRPRGLQQADERAQPGSSGLPVLNQRNGMVRGLLRSVGSGLAGRFGPGLGFRFGVSRLVVSGVLVSGLAVS